MLYTTVVMFSRILIASVLVAFVIGAAALPVHHDTSPRALVELQANKCAAAGGACADVDATACSGAYKKGLCPGSSHTRDMKQSASESDGSIAHHLSVVANSRRHKHPMLHASLI